MNEAATAVAPAPVPDVELRGATKAVDGRTILRDVSLTIAAGEQIAVIGPSGAGKTTLLRLIAGVLWPTSGSVTVLGQPIGQLGSHGLCKLRRQVGFLYQSDNLIPGLRVAHNVLMGRLGKWSLPRALWSLLWPQELPVAAAALDRVELGDRLWALPGQLSGGEQQRVAIARLLVQSPRILLADEPVSALDLRLGREVVRLLTALARERRTTLITSLHTLELLREGFDRVLALRDGRLLWDGPPQRLDRDLLRRVYGAEYQALHLDEVPLADAAGTADP
jgi:phosphonate transport system ATP-binding protein